MDPNASSSAHDHETATGGGGETVNVERSAAAGGGAIKGPQQEDEGSTKRLKAEHDSPGSDAAAEKAYSATLPLDLWIMSKSLSISSPSSRVEPLRQLYTSERDSSRIWKRAFENVDFPTLIATDWDLVTLTSFLHERPACIGCGSHLGDIERYFACRFFAHTSCLSSIFSSAADILEDVDLHPETLACLPSQKFKIGPRKSEDRFVVSQVKPMNDYLKYLDSTTLSSRDRGVRKAAREARDAMPPLSVYGSLTALNVRGRPKKRKEPPRALPGMLAARRRLNAVGFGNIDIRIIENHHLIAQDAVLDDAEWSEICPQLLPLVESARDDRIRRERSLNEQQKTKAYWHRFSMKVSEADRAFYPSLAAFAQFSSVKNLVQLPGDSGPEHDAFVSSINTALAEIRRQKKLSYARPLARALARAGHALPDETVKLLDPRGLVAPSDASWWRVPLDSSTDRSEAATVSEEELDTILTRFTSQAFWGFVEDRHQVGSCATISGAVKRSPIRHPSGVSVSARWIEILFSLLQAAGINDGPNGETAKKLENLGASFACRSSECRQTSLMTFSSLLQHVCYPVHHARSLNPHYSEGSFPVSDIVYVPQVATASTSSSTS
ncbi:hypothetical protein JCM11491_002673 [Sporobolomyces phaffii]